MYRDDDVARAARATALIDEIADLEREKLARASVEQRLEAARRELGALEVAMAPAPAEPATPGPGLLAHLCVFAAAATATYGGYSLLF